MSDEIVTLAVGLLVPVAGVVAVLWPYLSAHLADPQVTVWSVGTLTTYAEEVWLETDAVGPAATLYAWVLLAVPVAEIGYQLRQRRTTAEEPA